MEKYSVNITLDTDNDGALIEFFKNYNGKKVDAVRCLAEGYFKSKTSLNEEQKQEVKEIIKDMLSTVSLNISANEINIKSDNINKKEIVREDDYEEIEEIVDNCGINIEF